MAFSWTPRLPGCLSNWSVCSRALTRSRRAYETLAGMKRKGLFLSPKDEFFLEQLRRKAAES